jgi:hypothetical protein
MRATWPTRLTSPPWVRLSASGSLPRVDAHVHALRAVVEPSYSGARLADDDNVTLEFVKQMIQDFRDEKILHRRCVSAAPRSEPCLMTRRAAGMRLSSCCA